MIANERQSPIARDVIVVVRHLQHYQQLFFGSQEHRNQSYSGKRSPTIS